MKAAAGLLTACALTCGCAVQSPMVGMPATQQDALQARDLDAPPERAFAAAANTLVNAGYTIEVTDGEGGILTGFRREDPSVAEHAGFMALTAVITAGYGTMPAPPRYYGVCAQVLPRPGGLASVRICLYGHGDLKEEEAIVDDLWIQMQRDILARR